MKASEYFKCHENNFWQWEDGGDVIAIPDSYTIAYTQPVVDILKGISFQGIPKFGSFVLAMVAVSDRAKESINSVRQILLLNLKGEEGTVEDAIAFLNVIEQLSQVYKKGEKLTLLIQTIFHKSHNKISSKKLKGLFVAIGFQEMRESLEFSKESFSYEVCLESVYALALLYKQFPNTQSILTAMAGLVDIQTEELLPESEQEPTTKELSFVEKLIDEPRTFYVGSLVKSISAGLRIPRVSISSSDRPLGGVSDIGNKGDVDKLLLSEFAHDDVVFMSRLVNQESLFYNKEIPPEDNQYKRVLLIDTSLKNWGNIKNIAFACAIAINKDSISDIEAYVVGEEYHSVDLESTEGVINGLVYSDTNLVASKGLESFIKEASLKKSEVFYLSGVDAIQNQAFKTLPDYVVQQINYWVHPTSTGDVSMYRQTSKQKTFLHKISLTLPKLWEKPTTNKTQQKNTFTKSTHYPILFPNTIGTMGVALAEDGNTYRVTKECSLLRSRLLKNGLYKGWELVARKLPVQNGLFAVGHLEKGNFYVLWYNPRAKTVTLLGLDTDETVEFPFTALDHVDGAAFFMYESMFYCHKQGQYWKINTSGIQEWEINNSDIRDLANRWLKDLQDHQRHVKYHFSVLSNIKSLSINSEGKIVFNTHSISLNQQEKLTFNKISEHSIKVSASHSGRNLFVFPDGSEVLVEETGIFIFKSSDDSIPTFYFTSVVDRLGAGATQEVFAGYEDYHFTTRYDIVIHRNEKDVLDLERMFSEYISNFSLIESLNVTVNESIYMYGVSLEKPDVFKSELEQLGMTVELIKKGGNQEIISSKAFYASYIQPFINQVLAHENSN